MPPSPHAAGRTTQRLVNAIIDNGTAAGITRPFLLVFGWFVDRKLTEAFRHTAAAAEWGHAKPDDFCAWLNRALSVDRRAELRDVFEQCAGRFRSQDRPPTHRRAASPK
jgi:hypothetical protein